MEGVAKLEEACKEFGSKSGRRRRSPEGGAPAPGAVPAAVLPPVRWDQLGPGAAAGAGPQLDVPWDLTLMTQRCYTAESEAQDHIAMPLLQTGQLPGGDEPHPGQRGGWGHTTVRHTARRRCSRRWCGTGPTCSRAWPRPGRCRGRAAFRSVRHAAASRPAGDPAIGWQHWHQLAFGPQRGEPLAPAGLSIGRDGWRGQPAIHGPSVAPAVCAPRSRRRRRHCRSQSRR